MAPKEAPVLPDGWCEFGTPTATTGECMCALSQCVGPGCVSQAGFSWYTLECESCACEAPPRRRPAVEKRSAAIVEARRAREEESPRPLRQRIAPAIDDDATLFDHAFEWLDEHGHKVLACVFVAGLLCVFLPALVLKTVTSVTSAEEAVEERRRASGGGLRSRRRTRGSGSPHVV